MSTTYDEGKNSFSTDTERMIWWSRYRNRKEPEQNLAAAMSDWPPGLKRTAIIGSAVLAIQFLGFVIWSQVQSNRFGLSFDFTQFGQAWYLIAHGHLNPYITVKGALFWRDHSSFLFWITAPLWYLWPHPVTLMWLQDAAAVAAEAVAFRWMCQLIAEKGKELDNIDLYVFALSGMILLVGDPWITWSITNDFHVEIFSVLFVLLAAKDFFYERERAWIWVVLALLTSNLAATYLVGLSLSMFLAGRRWWRHATGLLASGFGWSWFTNAIHGDLGSAFYGYTYLVPKASFHHGSASITSVLRGVLRHPIRAFSQIWHHHASIWGDLASGGTVGLFSVWAFGVPFVALAESALNSGSDFISPNTGSQNFPEYIFIPLGTIMLLLGLRNSRHRWIRRSSLPILILVSSLVIGWSGVWLSRTAQQWLLVTPSAAQTLSEVNRLVPQNSEVIVSQGVVGGFATRNLVYPIQRSAHFPITSHDVWFVITPRLGIELQSVAAADSLIGELSNLPQVILEVHHAGVWAFRWTPPQAMKTFTSSAQPTSISAFDATSNAGYSDTSGPSSTWHAQSNGAKGYVVASDYFRETTRGEYVSTVTLSCNGPTNIELWDATSKTLLARNSLLSTGNKIEKFTLSAYLSKIKGQSEFDGIFPWISPPPPAYPGDQLEVRVWSPGNTSVSVFQVSVQKKK